MCISFHWFTYLTSLAPVFKLQQEGLIFIKKKPRWLAFDTPVLPSSFNDRLHAHFPDICVVSTVTV
eukprot:m.15685 g.15685  ORF g.15685 m.15685 type:complete len:66 (+) comp6703_c1_seq1:117-314(+)